MCVGIVVSFDVSLVFVSFGAIGMSHISDRILMGILSSYFVNFRKQYQCDNLTMSFNSSAFSSNSAKLIYMNPFPTYPKTNGNFQLFLFFFDILFCICGISI